MSITQKSGGETMAIEQLKHINVVMAKNVPNEICGMLIKKGLTLAQAEAILEQAKDLLRHAEI